MPSRESKLYCNEFINSMLFCPGMGFSKNIVWKHVSYPWIYHQFFLKFKWIFFIKRFLLIIFMTGFRFLSLFSGCLPKKGKWLLIWKKISSGIGNTKATLDLNSLYFNPATAQTQGQIKHSSLYIHASINKELHPCHCQELYKQNVFLSVCPQKSL